MPNFCHNCGKQMQHGWKACPFCETSLSSLTATPKPQQAAPPQNTFIPVAVGEEDDEASYLDRITHLDIRMNRLELDIQVPKPMGETLGTAMANPLPFNKNEVREPVKADQKQVLEDFKKEASAIKPESRLHTNKV